MAWRLAARHLSFAYGEHAVLDDVSLSLEAGRVVCLLGPNGAGKSTLIGLLTGRLKPARGEIVTEGMSPSAIGLVPQAIALYPWLTAAENCRAFARFARLPRRAAAENAVHALALTDCTGVADVPVRRLSGGYQRRVNIAAALVLQPKALILDEPTVGVDLDARLQIIEIIRRLRAEGVAILLVTHDFAEADALADRVACLEHGQLIASGTPAELVRHVFGERKRIEIVLADRPNAETKASLRALGAQASGNELLWHAFEETEGWNAARIAERLRQAGVAFEELRLRKPGIEALYSAMYPSRAAA